MLPSDTRALFDQEIDHSRGDDVDDDSAPGLAGRGRGDVPGLGD